MDTLKRAVELMQITSDAMTATPIPADYLNGFFFGIETAINSIQMALDEQRITKNKLTSYLNK